MGTDVMTNWHKLVEAEKVVDGRPYSATIGNLKIGVFEVDGDYYAIGNVCTHAFALLTNGFQEGCLVECPLHAGFFDIKTGRAQGGIVDKDVDTFSVKKEDGWLYIAVDDERAG
ncbi:non-heme iron oxygenase ferredoxin subunit [Sphingopyxis sp. Q841]|uniref:non-heme iron oxygenase ferredoxin subunit n=1 Tax=Sphingopyxis sp. Q841 TaxID=3458250 RepID=UPI00403753DF